jgi:hypothetical protein
MKVDDIILLGAQRPLKQWIICSLSGSHQSIYFCRSPNYLFLLHQEFEVVGVCYTYPTFATVEKLKVSLVCAACSRNECTNITFRTSKDQPPIKYLVNSNRM